jgi:hypothetical protein
VLEGGNPAFEGGSPAFEGGSPAFEGGGSVHEGGGGQVTRSMSGVMTVVLHRSENFQGHFLGGLGLNANVGAGASARGYLCAGVGRGEYAPGALASVGGEPTVGISE